jgi:putative transposase
MVDRLIHKIHTDSFGTYGAPRVHAELTLGYGIVVSHNNVELPMRRASSLTCITTV